MLSIQSAVNFIKIEKNTDYSNREQYPKQISILHCIKTNNIPIIIKAINGNSVEFPPGSFVQGAIYPISAQELKYTSDDIFFVGYINS